MGRQPGETERRSRQKHGKGEGTISRRGDGRWEARLTLPGGRRKSWYGKTRQEAQTKLSKARYEYEERGIEPADERTTIAQRSVQWLQQVRARVSETTYVRYEYNVRLHILPQLGRTRMARLTPPQVQSLYAYLLTDGKLGTTSVNIVHRVLHRMLADALSQELVVRNASDNVRAPRPSKTEECVLNLDESKLLMATAERLEDRYAALWTLAIATGMRIGEMLALTWKDVDFARGKVTVSKTLMAKKGALVPKVPKTKSSNRQIQLGADVLSALRRHRTNQAAERLRAGNVWQDLGIVFCREDGFYTRANRIALGLDRLLKLAELPHMRVHDLRHTAATLALRGGQQIKQVSEMLGHSSVSITMDRYQHVTPDIQGSLAEAMNNMLFG